MTSSRIRPLMPSLIAPAVSPTLRSTSGRRLITIAPKALSVVTASLNAIPEVTTLHSVSGTFDLIAIIAAPSISELDQLIDGIGTIDGVERTLSSIILSTRISR